MQEPPFTIENSNSPTPNSRYDGYIIDLIDRISENLNFTYDIRLVADGQYGVQNRNEYGAIVWTGMVREVVIGEADIAAAALSITPERQQVLDFTIPYINQGLTVLTLRESNPPVSVFQAFLPLRIEVWIGIVITLIIIAAVTTCINRLSPYDYYDRKFWKTEKENELEAFSFSNNLWYTLESFLSQGAERTSRSISARLITAMWWLASVIMIATYTANLTAFLTVNSLHATIESLQDLARTSGISYGVMANTSTETFFLHTSISPYKDMKYHLKNVANTAEGIERVLAGTTEPYAFISDTATLDYAKSKNCNLTTIGSFKEDSLALAVQKESLYWKEISIQVLKLREEGYLDILRAKW
ncbi:uncharacterized protein TRIADDRAFT_32461 [Trichoplax adhaerens]|uniref:Ionotropic glutamate receptor C-terminal domain-containing protein n=1 Tax=Trichoplax adhaerens TaxID=10228 RepID=B3SAV7_TRIAD|nr:hypothetical protein TRIADDRAFT_32461 [Trichoplax adhaerens]EDV20221.1 hypothetical protein TRIADDRAFT_32461 [Trichoplax adhaerens]|eukprot:XP_002117382.1 hypothetical protein TRIADDRAFT_32461 [Trichoplax adhaerens]